MKCKICGTEFEKTGPNQKYCSVECSDKAKKLQWKQNSKRNYISSLQNKPSITATCEYCGKEFTKQHGNQIYCSKRCADNRFREQNNINASKHYHHVKKLRGGDKCWGLGSGRLGPHKHEDWNVEFQKVNNELARLGLPSK